MKLKLVFNNPSAILQIKCCGIFIDNQFLLVIQSTIGVYVCVCVF